MRGWSPFFLRNNQKTLLEVLSKRGTMSSDADGERFRRLFIRMMVRGDFR